MKKWTIQESVRKMKLLNETVGMGMMTDIEEMDTPKATRRDFEAFEDCLEKYNIEEDVLSNAYVFVNVQLSNMGINNDDPNYYTMRIGLMTYNLMRNGHDMMNEDPSNGETCCADIHNEFLPGR